MVYCEAYNKLLYHYEILKIRMNIRDQYLQTAVKEVYENIGQSLSLMGIQLYLLQEDSNSDKIQPTRGLVGQTMRDIRNLSKLIQPQSDPINSRNFLQLVEAETKLHFPDALFIAKQEPSLALTTEKILFLYSLVQDTLTLLKEKENGQLLSASLTCTGNKLSIRFEYRGEQINNKTTDQSSPILKASVFDKVEWLGGKLKKRIMGPNRRKITFVIPTI